MGTLEKIQDALENYGLVRSVHEDKEDDEKFDLALALEYYRTPEKAK
jgi:hypothetical protein